MQRIFNMLIQNLTNMGLSLTQINFWDDYIHAEFTDGESKFEVNITKKAEEVNNNGN